MRRLAFAAVAVTVLTASAAPAAAAVMNVKWEGWGVVADTTGLLGRGQNFLMMGDFTLEYAYDTTAGLMAANPDHTVLYGGIGPATLKLYFESTWFTAALSDPVFSQIIHVPGDASRQGAISHAVTNGSQTFDFRMQPTTIPPLRLDAPFVVDDCGGCVQDGRFRTTGDLFIGDFDVHRLTVTRAPVPEPAAWAVMVLGFLAAGAAIRQRRGAVPA